MFLPSAALVIQRTIIVQFSIISGSYMYKIINRKEFKD